MKILISACLAGARVRYDNLSFPVTDPVLLTWQGQGLLVPVCPEVLGGLAIPRSPAEIAGGSGNDVLKGKSRIINKAGEDVTACFIRGAKQTLAIAEKYKVCLAVLKSKSPSCGSGLVYDGSFTGRLIHGEGVTAALFKENNIPVFSEKELHQALDFSRSGKK